MIGGRKFFFFGAKDQTKVRFKSRSPETAFFTSRKALNTRLSRLCHRISRFCLNNKFYFGVRAIKITQISRSSAWNSYLSSQRFYLKKSAKTVKQKSCFEKDTCFYNCLSFEKKLTIL